MVAVVRFQVCDGAVTAMTYRPSIIPAGSCTNWFHCQQCLAQGLERANLARRPKTFRGKRQCRRVERAPRCHSERAGRAIREQVGTDVEFVGAPTVAIE